MFRWFIGSEMNWYVYEVLYLLYFVMLEMVMYDFRFLDVKVVEEMSCIFEVMSCKMWVIVVLRWSGKFVIVCFVIVLVMVFFDKDMNILLMVNIVDMVWLYLEFVYEFFKIME